VNQDNELQNSNGALDQNVQNPNPKKLNLSRDAAGKLNKLFYDPKDSKKFFLVVGIVPAFLTVALSIVFAILLYSNLSYIHLVRASFLHFITLIVFVILVWIPVYLAVPKWSERKELGVVMGRSALLFLMVWVLFPHRLVQSFFNLDQTRRTWFYWLIFIAVGLAYLASTYYTNRHTAVHDVRIAAEPQERRYTNRLLWLDALSIFLTFFAVIVIELYFLAMMGNGKIDAAPYELFTKADDWENFLHPQKARNDSIVPGKNGQSPAPSLDPHQKDSSAAQQIKRPFPDTTKSDTILASATVAVKLAIKSLDSSQAARIDSPKISANAKMPVIKWRLLAWFCASILCALILVLWACLPAHLMKAILIPVTFHERDIKDVFFKSYRYLGHFMLAVLLKHPIIFPGSLFLLLVFNAAPAFLIWIEQTDMLAWLVQVDEVILVLGIFVAWFTPITLAAIMPDETFGEYFNQRLANHLMMVQGHAVFIGHGDLGKRVLDREINNLRVIHEQTNLRRREKMFFEVVTPDLRLEQLCSRAVVLEHSSKDVIFSGTNALLGNYGVVSACKRTYKSRDMHGNVIHPERRFLVPIVLGEAKEPFISSRVNLERATLIICMVPDPESVQAIFERAAKINVNAIICVTRSDQISYLTYRSRHKPIILVYPKHSQGITLGGRLWAAMLKVRAVRKMSENWWPRVLIIGNNKANHYMLETLWTNLPGNHSQKRKTLEKNFAFIVTAPNEPLEYPLLKENKKTKNKKREMIFDKYWPATFITGSRYPYPPAQVSQSDPVHIPTREVNAADIHAFEACLEHHAPDILVINHEEVETSLLILARCMRALERLKTRHPQNLHLPFLLLAAAQGDDWERLSLGDATQYYDALCKLHREDLTSDLSYPEHAHYDHYQRELIGESISDCHADAEEMITGARITLQKMMEKKFNDGQPVEPDRPAKPHYIEINSCLPNRPGALADYVAQLAGLEFSAKTKKEIEALWKSRTNRRKSSSASSVWLPSFQYLRHVKLDPWRETFALTGYATLAEIVDDITSSPHKPSKIPWAVRIFAMDGRNYIEHEDDPTEAKLVVDKDLPARVQEEIPDPDKPGVPEIIDRVTNRHSEKPNTIGEFHQVLLDPQDDHSTGPYACPGMAVCRIAAFQDYVLASNDLRMQDFVNQPNEKNSKAKLFHARNYYCCSNMDLATPKEIPHPASPYARIFCCCRGQQSPGMIAMILNTLLFRANPTRMPETGKSEDDWVINIDYFKDISCQNPYFTLNRLFGTFQPKIQTAGANMFFPLHLLRILPIGGMSSVKAWYDYTRTLHHFLCQNHKKNEYIFYWLDENRTTHYDLNDIPKFDEKNHCGFPVLLVIKQHLVDAIRPREDAQDFCELCGKTPKEYDCRKLRLWV